MAAYQPLPLLTTLLNCSKQCYFFIYRYSMLLATF